MKFFLTIVTSIFVFTASAQFLATKTITIEPHLRFQNYEHFKRLTLESPDSHAEYLDGFDFEWGYTYKVRVSEKKLKHPYSDGTQYEYKFNRIVSKTKVSDSAEFRLFLDASRYYYQSPEEDQSKNVTFKHLKENVYLYFDAVEIEVPPYLQSKFDKIVAGEITAVGKFKYLDNNRILLTKL